MNRNIIRSAVVATLAVTVSATALASHVYTSQRDGIAIRKCMNAVPRDEAGQRLRYTDDAWIDGPKDGRVSVFINAIARGEDGREPRRVACELNRLGSRVVATRVEAGRFVDKANA